MARVYDAASRLTQETLSVGATSYNLGYGYDADNRQTAVIYPSGDVVDRAFTDRNQLSCVSFNGASVANLSYDDGRRLTTKNFGNGIVENRTYRNDNLIASIATAGVDTFTYTWDANKRKLTQTETGIPTNDQTYSYDSEDRLTNFARTNGDAQSWNLSLVGDWNQFNKNGTVETRTHNAVHELLTVNTTPLTYDVKGNLTQNSNGQFYTWDVENRLILATDGFNTLGTYAYDALGRRVSKTVNGVTTTFVSDGLQEVAEYVNGALTQSYVYGSYIDEPLMMVKANGDKFYYHANDLYSVAALTDNNGNVVERYKYDPYGKATILAADGVTVLSGSTVNNAIGFTGRRLDTETGLMYYRNRMFDVGLGRFLSRDPLDYYEAETLDLYSYCAGRPTVYVDPKGLREILVLKNKYWLGRACLAPSSAWGTEWDERSEPPKGKPSPPVNVLGTKPQLSSLLNKPKTPSNPPECKKGNRAKPTDWHTRAFALHWSLRFWEYPRHNSYVAWDIKCPKGCKLDFSSIKIDTTEADSQLGNAITRDDDQVDVLNFSWAAEDYAKEYGFSREEFGVVHKKDVGGGIGSDTEPNCNANSVHLERWLHTTGAWHRVGYNYFAAKIEMVYDCVPCQCSTDTGSNSTISVGSTGSISK